MKRVKLLVASAPVILLGMEAPAAAVQAFGNISFVGTDTYNDTSINFTGPASILGTSTGTFAALGNCFGCVAMTSFNYAAFTPVTLLTAMNNGSTLTFRLESLTDVTRNAFGSLSIDGIGTVSQTASRRIAAGSASPARAVGTVSVTSPSPRRSRLRPGWFRSPPPGR